MSAIHAPFRFRRTMLAAALAAGSASPLLGATESGHDPGSAIQAAAVQPLSGPPPDEAWWTGPMLANTPATPAKGGINGETFFFEQAGKNFELYGSLTLISYGVTDRLALEIKPMFGWTRTAEGVSKLGAGDLNLMAHYRLTPPNAPRFAPTVAFLVQRSVPIGRYDRLDTMPAAALGSGVSSTTFALYAQQTFRLPNGRLFRTRINVSRTFAGHANLDGESVYGTAPGFSGRVRPGDATAIIIAGEYSITRRWVAALDMLFERTGRGFISGRYDTGSANPGPAGHRLGSSRAVGLAPAVEYNINANLGVLVGTRFKFRGRNSAASVTPALALVFSLEP